jgi:hypothetical protein
LIDKPFTQGEKTMVFFRILKSKSERDFELKSKLRQANNKIDHHVRKLVNQAVRYKELCERAFSLHDHEQFADLAKRYHQVLAAYNRWQRYQLKLNAMELQRDEVRATEEFLSGIGALTQSIMQGVSPAEVQRVAKDIELAEHKCQELEQSMSDHMVEILEPTSGMSTLDDTVLQRLPPIHEDLSIYDSLGATQKAEFEGLAPRQLNKMSFEEALNYYRD